MTAIDYVTISKRNLWKNKALYFTLFIDFSNISWNIVLIEYKMIFLIISLKNLVQYRKIRYLFILVNHWSHIKLNIIKEV